jgi:hypothetical protein
MEYENARVKRGRESIDNNSRTSNASSVFKTNKKQARASEDEESSEEEEIAVQEGANNSQKQDRLPAVKILLRNSVVPQYTAPRALVKEILRCKKVQPNNIKFASLNGCILTIATDDKETHQELTKEWCQDAFTAGTIFATPRREQQSTIVIKGFPPQAELEKEDIEDLNQQGILDPIRIYNKKLQQNTTLLKAKTSNQKSLEDALKHGVKIGFTIYRVEHEKKVHQCFKCQKFGHSASECRNQVQVCPKCTGHHSLKDCTSDNLKCANCNGNHPAFSRSCQFIKDPKAAQKQPQQQKQTTQPSKSAHHTNQVESSKKTYANAVLNKNHGHQPAPEYNAIDITALVKEQVQLAMRTLAENLKQNIQETIKETFAEQLQTMVKEKVIECIEEITKKRLQPDNQQPRANSSTSQENKQATSGKCKNSIPPPSNTHC